jgi:hypothetical protein
VAGACVAAPADAQYQFTGPGKCTTCHDHDRQAAKWQREEPALLKDKAHYNTRKQLDAPKSASYAKAIGLADPYDLKGSCVACHATVFRGDANAGVSCESCHGAASGYLELHQVKGSYAKSVAAGLRDLKGKTAVVAKTCVACHFTPDKRLAAAGHPTGANFDAGASLRKLVHWTTTYDFAQVTAAGKAALGPGARAAAAAPAPPAAPPAAGAARPAGGTTAPASRPAAPPPGAEATAPLAATGNAAAAPPAAPAAPPAPWDWDQPVRPLPADYVPTAPAAEPPAAPAADAPAPAVRTPRVRRPAPPPAAPSLAEDLPLATADAAAPLTAPAAPTPAAVSTSATARVAAARGLAASALGRALRQGTRAPNLPAPARPREFKGPDGELLRLQDEALALALEALRRP